jgi:hypothetical protein
MGGSPRYERLLDGMPAGNQFLLLGHEVRGRRAAGRPGPMGVGTGRRTVRAARPGRNRTLPEGSAVISARSFGSPDFRGIDSISGRGDSEIRDGVRSYRRHFCGHTRFRT